MDYTVLAKKVLKGDVLSRKEARLILEAPRDDLQDVLSAALMVREHYFGRKVKLCVLQNAQSGLCPEDCHYCSQSSASSAEIEKYAILPKPILLKGADRAAESSAKRYCIVTSGRAPSDRDIEYLCDVIREIKHRYPTLEICCSLGFLDLSKALRLKGSGVGWINHNLNTSENFYPKICKTHTYRDRLKTLRVIKQAGLSTCSGGIVGMGETQDDILDLAFAFHELDVDAIPINFLHPIEGTPLEKVRSMDSVKGLLILSLIRLLNPKKEVRAAGGREFNLKDLQKYVIYPANSIFIEGYLTTPGQKAEEARKMIEEMGFEVEEGERIAL